MTDTRDLLERRADRGEPRGADAVFAAAVRGEVAPTPVREAPPTLVGWPRWLVAGAAAAIVLALVGAAVVILTRAHDHERDLAPVDTGPPAEAEGPIEGALFGAETGTTLLVSSGNGAVVALDLDTGVARRYPDVDVAQSEITAVEDRFVYLGGGRLWSAPLDLSAAPGAMPGLPADRPLGDNDLVRFFPSGDTGRFWVSTGPYADHPEREFRAEERDAATGEVTAPVVLLTYDTFALGATSDLLAVSAEGGVDLRDRATGDVVRRIVQLVATDGDRFLWQDCCSVHVLDTTTGAETETAVAAQLPYATAPLTPVSVSPDGRHLAYLPDQLGGSRLQIVDLETGTTQAVPGTEAMIGSGGPLVWSPDSQWVFGAAGDDPVIGGLTGYHLGDDRATSVTVAGLIPSSLIAVERSSGPDLGAGDAEACPPDRNYGPSDPPGTAQLPGEPQENVSVDAPCQTLVTAGLRPLPEGFYGEGG